MKVPKLFVALFCCLFCSHHTTFSQGWSWLEGSTSVFSGAFVDGWGVAIDGKGNIYTLGGIGLIGGPSGEITLFGSYDITDSSTFPQTFVTKSNSSGTFLWAIASQNTAAYPIGIVCSQAGDVYIYGTYSGSCHFTSLTISSTSTATSYFLAKFDSSGNVQWLENVAGVDSTPLGLPTSGIAIDGNGYVYVAGSFPNPTMTIGSTTLTNSVVAGGSFDCFVAKYDSLGNNVWAKSYGGNRDDETYGLSVTKAGETYLSGFYYSSSVALGSTTLTDALGALDTPYVFLTKLDVGGAPLWAVSAKASQWDNMGSLACDKDDNVYMTGGYHNLQITFGTSTLTNTSGGDDAYVVKFNQSGSVVFANNIDGINVNSGYSLAVDSCENVWACGMMGGAGIGAYSVNISGHVLSSPAGAHDPFYLVEYDSAGAYVNSLATQSGAEDQANAIAVDNQGNLYLGADYDVSSFTLGSTTLSLGSTTIENMFLAKYTYAVGSCGASSLDVPGLAANTDDILLFPNPAFSELTITSADVINKLEILNLVGQTVYSNTYNTGAAVLNIACLQAGVYFVKINGATVRKFVKE